MLSKDKAPEDAFRESLQDVITLVRKLEPFCKSTGELVDILELATMNVGQLNILISTVTKK